jgi:hypothetical protein
VSTTKWQTAKERRTDSLRDWLDREAADQRGAAEFVAVWSELLPWPSWSRSRLSAEQALACLDALLADRRMVHRVTRDGRNGRCIEVMPR